MFKIRKSFLLLLILLSLIIPLISCSNEKEVVEETQSEETSEIPSSNQSEATVYFTSDISPAGLNKTFEALNWTPTDNKVIA